MEDNKLLKKALFKFLRRGVYVAGNKRAKTKIYLYLMKFKKTIEEKAEELKIELKEAYGEKDYIEYFADIEHKAIFKENKITISEFNKTDWKRATRQETKLGLRGKEKETKI